MAGATLWVFSYGTLRAPELQEILLGRRVEMRRAVLEDFAVQVDPHLGYLMLAVSPGSRVEGCLLEVTPAELLRFDAWEEVPLYQRAQVQARLAHTHELVSAICYLRPDVQGEPVSDPNCLATKDWTLVLAEARDLAATLPPL
ncbi:uncharacterized protein MONBRDRAFT_34713 [Monosiga brevicollis MX1]|uniref:Putative gamma-glutamylcyclotransferase n=1 Tax=Monosiga brevicollis TaxID=81824 RepID=A9VDI5_MONBE|nr:uncharacterized protein MONBRDRAFT_34713 [Monosiga brevicollis MX1]EDQ84374.1 predicted protein [Monosiga brevicollis MX1]|eukprot:XP_001750775.1 hypothetical protein [Monosiga brevicollis MX1]